MRKLLSLFVAALFSVTMFADVTKVYCKVDQAWWLAKNDKGVAGAVAAHYWTEGEGAVSTDWPGIRMEAVEGETHIWSLDIDPEKAQKIIFVRVPAEGEVADWGAKSKTQTFPADDNTLFTITNETAVWGDPGCDGVWSKFVPSEPEPEPEYFLVRASNEWAVVEADKFAVTETEGEFKLAATLVLGDEIKVLGIAGEDTTWYPDGLGNAFEITEKFTGEHDIYFRPAGNDDWKSFHEGGFFWMGANPDPEPELVELNLVPGPWVDGSNAKIAAWIWGEKLAGEWTEFIGLEGDTLKFNVKETADSLIFVRFKPDAEDPTWEGGDGYIWNRLPDTEIDYVGKTYTITAYDKGQWDPFIIATEVLKLVPGKWAEGGAKMNAWVWGENLNGDWAGFFEGTGDTLSVEISSLADSIVFVRFNDTVSVPKWDGGEGYIWNSLAGDTIDHVGLTYTITDWWSGQWEVYVPAPETKELKFVPGVWTTDDAVLAAWVWGGGVEGAWYAFAGEGDTLSTTIPGVAEKAIFVRFNDTVTVFAWNDDITWGKTDEEEIEDCGIFFVNTWDNYSWCEAVEPVVPSEEDGFFLIGTLTSWKPLAEFKFEPNPGQEGEYQLETTLKAGDEFKIAEQKNQVIDDEDWYLSENHVVTAEEAGDVTVYFRPEGDGGEGWIEGIIYIHKAATGVEETAVEGKAVKALRDGQLVIIKNGVRYNVIGIRF
jgi:hypothetical protein